MPDPTPIPPRPFNPPPRLVDTRLPPPGYVPVTITRGFQATYGNLDAVERPWGPDRARLVEELLSHDETLENAHWDWRNKARRPKDWHCIATVECDNQTQGIMAIENLLRRSELTPNTWLLYVDILEAAPWNYRVPQDRNKPVVREARYKGVGTLLLGEAIRMSIGTTAGGRVGLHALPQAEHFYEHSGMTRIGPDPNCYNLVYFEYPDGVAAIQLTSMGLSI